jgi:hypothetical protein
LNLSADTKSNELAIILEVEPPILFGQVKRQLEAESQTVPFLHKTIGKPK